MYQISVPMPYSIEHINKILDINKELKKSKITCLYFSLPCNSQDFTGFEQGRYITDKNTDFGFFKPLIEYSLEKNFDFIYLLNSPKVYNYEFDNLDLYIKKLDKLINKLSLSGCKKLRVCNPQLIAYINKNYPDFELYLSTSSELQSIRQYSVLFSMFKNIKEFVPSFDLNKNFKLLKNIKKKFPDIEIELMMNEGCIPACPLRTSHNIFITGVVDKINDDEIFNSRFFLNNCYSFMGNDISLYLCNCNIIYPWEADEYFKIGIKKFKLVGRNTPEFHTGKYFDYYRTILKGIDNFNNIKNEEIRYFNNYIYKFSNINLTVNEIKQYLPKTEHFKKYGHLCASMCGVECKYCYKCAEKIQKILNKKQEEQRKMNIPFCV